MKIVKRILAVVISLPIAALLVSYIMSPTWAGEDIAIEKKLPYEAVCAHRGAAYLAPELTMPAFEIARDLGADYIETDVQRTKDGVLINYHDDDLKRTTNVEDVFPGRVDDPVGSFTWAELKRLDAGSWFNEKNPDRARKGYEGITIPTFEQYIDMASKGSNRPGLLIELKKPENFPGIEKEIVALLVKKGWLNADHTVKALDPSGLGEKSVKVGYGANRVIFQSFDYHSIVRLKEIAPKVMRSYIVDEDTEKDLGGFEPILERARENGSEISAVGYLGWPWYVGDVHDENKYLFVWTLDEKWHFYMFSFFGVDGVITNRFHDYMAYTGRQLSQPLDEVMARFDGQ